MPLGNVMRVTLMEYSFGAILILDDLVKADGLTILTRFDPDQKICSSMTKNRLVCSKLIARQI